MSIRMDFSCQRIAYLSLFVGLTWGMVQEHGTLYAQEQPGENEVPETIVPFEPQSPANQANQLVNLKELERQLREKLAQTNNDPYVLHKLGSVLYRQGKILEAREIWDQSSSADPNVADADVSVAIELIVKGDIRAAVQALKTAESRNSKNPHLYLARGDLMFRQQKFAAAEAEFQRALELNPQLLVTYIWLGRFYQMRNEFKKALEAYQKGTEVAPERAEGWIMLSAIQFRLNDVSASLESLKQAEKNDPDQIMAEIRLSNFYLSNKDLLGGMKYLKIALTRQPDNVSTRMTLADVLMRLNQTEDAKQQLEKVIEFDQDANYLKALIALAELERRDGNYQRAEAIYRKGLATQPENPVLNNNLAMTLLCAGAPPKEVLELVEIAMQSAGQNPAVQGTYCSALLDAGRTEEAFEKVTTLVRLLPTDPWVRYTYGKLLAVQMKTDEAREQLEGCLILDAKFPRKEEVESLLASLK